MTQETRQEFSHFLWKRDAAIIMAGGVEWSLCASVDLPRSLPFPEPGLSSLRGEGALNKEVCAGQVCLLAASAFLVEGYLGTRTQDLLRHGRLVSVCFHVNDFN